MAKTFFRKNPFFRFWLIHLAPDLSKMAYNYVKWSKMTPMDHNEWFWENSEKFLIFPFSKCLKTQKYCKKYSTPVIQLGQKNLPEKICPNCSTGVVHTVRIMLQISSHRLRKTVTPILRVIDYESYMTHTLKKNSEFRWFLQFCHYWRYDFK